MISRMIIPLIALFSFICHPVFAFEDLAAELKRYVPVLFNSSKCSNNPKSDGWYLPDDNRLDLCVDNIQNNWPENKHKDIYRKVLMHEAVHLAQDCNAGFYNSDLKVFNANIDIPDYVSSRYDIEDHKIEAEAFSYWHKGSVALDLVRKFCKALN